MLILEFYPFCNQSVRTLFSQKMMPLYLNIKDRDESNSIQNKRQTLTVQIHI